MTSRDFCYWLQGHFELTNSQELTVQQTTTIKRHLALVFKHEIDPSYGGNQPELQKIHDGGPIPPTPPPLPYSEEPRIMC